MKQRLLVGCMHQNPQCISDCLSKIWILMHGTISLQMNGLNSPEEKEGNLLIPFLWLCSIQLQQK